MHHCDPKLGVIRVHGRYFCSYTLLKHTWASCKIFCRLGDCKMHQNDLKCGDLVDFVATQSHLEGGAIWANFGHLVQKIRILALMKSNGHNFNRNELSDPENPR